MSFNSFAARRFDVSVLDLVDRWRIRLTWTMGRQWDILRDNRTEEGSATGYTLNLNPLPNVCVYFYLFFSYFFCFYFLAFVSSVGVDVWRTHTHIHTHTPFLSSE